MKVRVRRGTGNLTRWATTWSTAQPVVECFTGGDIPVWVVWVVWVRPNKLNELLSNTMRLLYLINGTTRVVECSTGGIFWKHLSCDLWQPVTECSMDGTFFEAYFALLWLMTMPFHCRHTSRQNFIYFWEWGVNTGAEWMVRMQFSLSAKKPPAYPIICNSVNMLKNNMQFS